VVVVAAALMTAVGLAASARAGMISGLLRGPSEDAKFVTQCDFSHRAPDDPIVKPALPGASHSHDFMGNLSTDAFSTYESLRDAGSTCSTQHDQAGYWVPTLYDGGVAVAPQALTAYYLPGEKNPSYIKPFPAGLEAIAGNSKATTPQSLSVVQWGCEGRRDVARQSTPPVCPGGSDLELLITFPDCWDGTNLDSPDHSSHLSYAAGGHCDYAHSTPIPRLLMSVVYPITGGSAVTLASGSALTGHADFFNAWDQGELGMLVRRCLNYRNDCGLISD
jgi:hypothetical protein